MSKKNKESTFTQEVNKSVKRKNLEELPKDKQVEFKQNKLDNFFERFNNNSNRILFYCPDVPFAIGMVKIIYETVHFLNKNGHTAYVLHEVKGYKPNWFDEEWVKDVPVKYLSEKKNKKGKKENYTKPTFTFEPTDTIVVPDFLKNIMENFSETRPLQKVVFAFGYDGLKTLDLGTSFASYGFYNVICISQTIADDYQKLFPDLNYYVLYPYINEETFQTYEMSEYAPKINPNIALNIKDRKRAQEIINIFRGRYPFLNMFDFRILKKLSVTTYAEVLRDSVVQVFDDVDAGFSLPIEEALQSGVPTITNYFRGINEVKDNEGVIIVEDDDAFLIAEKLAEICLKWLYNSSYDFRIDETEAKFNRKNFERAVDGVFSQITNEHHMLFKMLEKKVQEEEVTE